ncbi:Putative undecaprenyl-diphosphatase YbjG [Variovorax sp. PBL-H6]|uniref:phosphatase PAP2 family protein n=1 Tax=Variovorax sp. PBL-H6 TaxID=434009 RepID=UPI0013165940|nr:phosphatase PAP2 family protein [Variovorax sp. PBL-H6]VTU28400.1 Putative undecaprenyl-diphosphatase YbjG [Variovorax sp. PBL-H6]
MQALNIALFQILGAGHNPNPVLLWVASNVAQQASWLCVALMAWAAWHWPAQRLYVLASLFAAGVAALLAHELADAFAMPRPFMLGLSPAHIEHGARGSLPSAHATVMFTVGLVFCLRAPLRKIGLALLAVAALTGWARIYVGVHFPFDVLAGLLLAALITAAFWVVHRLGRRFIAPLITRNSLRA